MRGDWYFVLGFGVAGVVSGALFVATQDWDDIPNRAERWALCSDLAALSDTLVVARDHPVCRRQLLNREEP